MDWKQGEVDMNEARFIELIAAYGADLSRWPEEDRGDAAAYLEAAPHRIKDIWESERSFDHLLALDRDSPVSLALEGAVLAAAPDRRTLQRPMRILSLPPLPRWAAGGALAASLALGFAVGYAEPRHPPAGDYANLLSLSDGGAGSVFLTVMDDGGH